MAVSSTIGLLLRLSADGEPLTNSTRAVMCGAYLALDDANAQRGTVVPAFTDLPTSVLPIRALAYDTRSEQSGGIEAYRNATRLGASVIVGPARSAVSLALGHLAKVDQVPLISYWASSSALSNDALYPYFGRTYPSDSAIVPAFAAFFAQMGWKYVSILHMEDTYGHSVRNELSAASITHGVDVSRTAVFDIGDVTSIRAAVNELLGGPNIILFLGFESDLEHVATAAWEAGLLTPEHAWVVSDSLEYTAVANARDPHTLAQRTAGWVSLVTSRDHSRFAEYWHGRTEACANDLFDVPAGAFAEALELASFVYDAVAAAVLGLAVQPAGPPQLLEAVRTADFEGASGHVRFSAGGDRDLRDLSVRVINWQLDQSGGIAGVLTATMGLEEGAELQTVAQTVWLGGRTEAPVDQITQQEEEQAARHDLNEQIALGAIITVGVLAPIALAVCAYKSMQRVRRLATIVRDYQAGLQNKLKDALATTSRMKFPATVVSLKDFVALGALRSHEELRNTHLLHFHDLMADVCALPHQIVFFSHQWTSFTHPDPTNQQYQTMVAALHRVVEINGWEADTTYVCYFSIPQRSRDTQQLAIASLSTYAALAHAFVIVAPTLTHEGTGRVCDVHTYNRRMWCRATAC